MQRLAKGSAYKNPTGLPALLGGALAKFPVVDDPESRGCIFLTEYRDPVDGERIESDGGKAVPQHGQDRFTPRGIKPSRQCHVEAEILHDVGVPPAFQMI